MLKVYVSSTYRDLKDCRALVREQLQRLDLDDVAMETYTAGPDRPVDKCLKDVARCDLYVGIFAWSYGFIPDGYDRSITELEYRKAVEAGKDVLIFLLEERAPWPVIWTDADRSRITGLRQELAHVHVCDFFGTPQ